MNNEIQITIELPNKNQVDISVSPEIRMDQLIDQIQDIYGLAKRPYTVLVTTKNLVIRENQTLEKLKITTGDILHFTEDLNEQSAD
ncbi:EsaB/YukD family protein [Ligilactobacillus sp. LYQ135]